jgi:hypothetical protein
METMEILNLIVAILTGISACIPLVIQLVRYVKMAIAEKNFGNIMHLVLDLMPEAEEKFSTGVERKKYVMSNVQSISKTLHYDVDIDKVSEMIDAIVAASKKVNIDKK